MRKQFSVPLMLLMALSASIFLVGCINLANLQLGRLHAHAHELGVRMALGATRGRVQADVMTRTLRLAATGIVVGAAASFAVAALIASLLFDTRPADPATFAGVVSVLAAVALLAGYLPARRASRINPMVALRNN